MKYLSFCGEPAVVGEKIGLFLRSDLAGRVADMKVDDVSEQKRRRERFLAILERVAPHWIAEAQAMATAAGLPFESLIDLNCLKAKPWVPTTEAGCTSVVAVGKGSKEGKPLLWKNRDERPHVQYAAHVRVAGRNGFLAGTNVGNLGLGHALNEKGLAGANNTGSPVREEIADPALSDCHLLRLVAESAANCDEALELIRDLLGDGFIGAAGYRRGMIFLFADANGKGLIVECSSRTLDFEWVEDGAVARANHFVLPATKAVEDVEAMNSISAESSRMRYRRAGRLLSERNHRVDVRDLMLLSRDRANLPMAICNDGTTFPWRTLSAFVHVIDDHFMAWVSNGHPAMTPYLPVYVHAAGVPEEWARNLPPPRIEPKTEKLMRLEDDLMELWRRSETPSSNKSSLPDLLAKRTEICWKLIKEKGR